MGAALLAIAATCSLAQAQAMGKLMLDPSVAAAPVEAAAPAVSGASPAALDGEREAAKPATDPAIEALRASLPAAAAGPKLQNPAGLTMPALPAVLPATTAPEPGAAVAMNTPAAPKEPASAAGAAPQAFAPVNPPPTSTPAPAAPAAPATPKPSAGEDSIESKPIHTRIQPPSGATSQPAAGGAGNAVTTAPGASSSFFSGAGSLAQVGAALAIVIGLIFVGKGLAKKFVPGARAAGGKGVIEILARHPLAKNQAIVLVRIGSQIVALNQGKEASESVLVISDQAEVARIIGQIEGTSPKSIQAGFNNLLANARMDLERGEDDTEQEADLRTISPENLDEQLEEMAAAKRQLMELRQHVRSVRDSLPRA